MATNRRLRHQDAFEIDVEEAAALISTLPAQLIRRLIPLTGFEDAGMSDKFLPDYFELALPSQALAVQRQVVKQVEHFCMHGDWAASPFGPILGPSEPNHAHSHSEVLVQEDLNMADLDLLNSYDNFNLVTPGASTDSESGWADIDCIGDHDAPDRLAFDLDEATDGRQSHAIEDVDLSDELDPFLSTWTPMTPPNSGRRDAIRDADMNQSNTSRSPLFAPLGYADISSSSDIGSISLYCTPCFSPVLEDSGGQQPLSYIGVEDEDLRGAGSHTTCALDDVPPLATRGIGSIPDSPLPSDRIQEASTSDVNIPQDIPMPGSNLRRALSEGFTPQMDAQTEPNLRKAHHREFMMSMSDRETNLNINRNSSLRSRVADAPDRVDDTSLNGFARAASLCSELRALLEEEEHANNAGGVYTSCDGGSPTPAPFDEMSDIGMQGACPSPTPVQTAGNRQGTPMSYSSVRANSCTPSVNDSIAPATGPQLSDTSNRMQQDGPTRKGKTTILGDAASVLDSDARWMHPIEALLEDLVTALPRMKILNHGLAERLAEFMTKLQELVEDNEALKDQVRELSMRLDTELAAQRNRHRREMADVHKALAIVQKEMADLTREVATLRI
ncbi:hypothetical protein ANO11243_046900 [Dothideomycetidae sp. 11243]|nr:hypothetical protein ANO11243_046900 [fungal sp. No.11243]